MTATLKELEEQLDALNSTMNDENKTPLKSCRSKNTS